MTFGRTLGIMLIVIGGPSPNVLAQNTEPSKEQVLAEAQVKKILGERREINASEKAYHKQALNIMSHYGIDDPKIPCSLIDLIDIYGRGDGQINPHLLVPAVSHSEWQNYRYKLSNNFGRDEGEGGQCHGVGLGDRVYLGGKCFAYDNVFSGRGKDAALKPWVRHIRDWTAYCIGYDVTKAVNEGVDQDFNGKLSRPSPPIEKPENLKSGRDDYLYPEAITYYNSNNNSLKYARECHPAEISASEISILPNEDVNAVGVRCHSMNGKKEISSRDVEGALGPYLRTEKGAGTVNPFPRKVASEKQDTRPSESTTSKRKTDEGAR